MFSLPAGQKQATWVPLAPRSGGGQWQLPLLIIQGARPGPTLAVSAGVHGDEYEGIAAIRTLYDGLAPNQLSGRLLMIPVCNVPAFEAGTRNSPVDGLNLARVFPGDSGGTLTQRIAAWMHQHFLPEADFYIDLHSGGVAYDIPTLIGYGVGDDGLGQASRAAAEAFGAPVLWGHPLPHPPGRTISSATALGIPSLYTEAPGGGFARPADVACFGRGVQNVMRHLGILPGAIEKAAVTHDLLGSGDLDRVLAAPAGGFFQPEVSLLDEVKAGDQLGTIYDLLGQPLATLQAEQSGVVIMLRRLQRVQAGDGLVHLTNRR